MKLLKTTLLILGATALITTSCKKKGCMDPLAQNYSAEAEKEGNKTTCTYEISTPATYTFTRNGNSTVSFGGQTTRMEMLSEMVTYMKTTNTAGISIAANTLKDMYANEGYTWMDALGLGMTGSTKQLKNKTAYGSASGSADVGVQNTFEAYMTSLANISATTATGVEDGMSGTAGVWANDGVKGPYLMNAEGKEYTQLIEKGLMCSVLMSQITVNYLGGIASDDNTELLEDKNYTEMEHHWDEAYGYFTDAIDFPTNGTDRFWGKYANGRETILGSATNISTAFKTGRAAIVSQDNTTRDAQVTIIRDELEKVVAGSAIHYLNSAKSNIANNVARNHSLSEAYAFLEGLKYGYNSINSIGMSSSQIDNALSYFESDFNTVTLDDINNAIDLIASNTGLESVKGSL
jgi:hypothetical protein